MIFRKIDGQVLARVIDELGLSFRRSRESWVFPCPICGLDKLYIKRTGAWNCFKCKVTHGYKGPNPEAPLSDLSGESRESIAGKLYGTNLDELEPFLFVEPFGLYNPPPPDLEEEDFGPEPIDWPYSFIPIDHPKAAKGAAYLAGRGIPLEIAKVYGIRYVPQESRVVFPVEENGFLFGYQKRLIVPGKYVTETGEEMEAPKALSSPGLPRESTVMFADRLVGAEHCIIAEGPIDAIKCHLCGGGNIATMGKVVSQGQLDIIKAQPTIKRVYVALDHDADAEAMDLIRRVQDDYEVYLMLPPEKGKDLGAMTFPEVRELFLNAPRVDSSTFLAHLKAMCL